MSKLFENKFGVERITKTDSVEYAKLMRIYHDNTPVEIKTNTNEITAWLDKKTDDNSFELLIFALYLDDSIVGMAMLGYVKKYRTIIVDYMALNREHKINAVFFSYLSLLQDYIKQNGYDVDYYVTEISNKHGGKNVDRESSFFKKLICLEGFGLGIAD